MKKFLLILTLTNTLLVCGMDKKPDHKGAPCQPTADLLITIFENHDCAGEAIFQKMKVGKSGSSRSRFEELFFQRGIRSDEVQLVNLIKGLAEGELEGGLSYCIMGKNPWKERNYAKFYASQNSKKEKELRVNIYTDPGSFFLNKIKKVVFAGNHFDKIRIVAKRSDLSDLDFSRYRNHLKTACYTLLAGSKKLTGLNLKHRNSSRAKK